MFNAKPDGVFKGIGTSKTVQDQFKTHLSQLPDMDK